MRRYIRIYKKPPERGLLYCPAPLFKRDFFWVRLFFWRKNR